ncbi:hypothetical protein HELRODRAFT_102787 [Helobdella robusta]|uniref:Cationic amino acid transporter C-terminal domain-containing protein n=1 Tax=Helobdella robusta TaxID=6412 RepID=T1EDB8_HELRO|nr:hypothetical protein HELRODRAFT_102787 [Helobdella robusta]ESN94973.1 hypothetical protein HELRODRAFT_102787 [Helobdella robusta]
MFKLGRETWIRFIVWLAIGLINYFGYGMRHSRERKQHLHSLAAANHGDVTNVNESAAGGGGASDDDVLNNDDDEVNDEEIVGSFPGASHGHKGSTQRGVRRSFEGYSGRFFDYRQYSVPDERTPLLV